MNRRNEWLGILAVIALVIVLGAIQFWPASSAPSGAVQIDSQDRSQSEASPSLDTESERGESDADTSADTEIVYEWIIDVDDLPDEAIDTLLLIDDGGPYPYRQDSSTFQNREGYLPQRSRNYYQEFTVETPGLDHRGALRIVTGADGEMYWTDDHYDTFAQIIGWSS